MGICGDVEETPGYATDLSSLVDSWMPLAMDYDIERVTDLAIPGAKFGCNSSSTQNNRGSTPKPKKIYRSQDLEIEM